MSYAAGPATPTGSGMSSMSPAEASWHQRPSDMDRLCDAFVRSLHEIKAPVLGTP